PDPNLGAARAEEPSPIVTPEPSAQTTEPQVEEQGTPQPAWAPDTEQTIAVTTAAPDPTPTAAPAPTPATAIAGGEVGPTTAAIAPPPAEATDTESPASTSPAASSPVESTLSNTVTPNTVTPEAVVPVETVVPEDIASEPTVSPEPIAAEVVPPESAEVIPPEPAEVDLAGSPQAHSPEMTEGQAAIADLSETQPTSLIAPIPANQPSPVATVSSTPSAPPESVDSALIDSIVVESLLETPAKPTARKPLSQPAALGETLPAATRSPRPGATPPIASSEHAARVITAARPASRTPSPRSAAAAIAPATRPNAYQVAEIRARAAEVQALMRDIRAAAGISVDAVATEPATKPAPSRRVSQPEASQRGPQLPLLPSRAPRRSSTAEQIAAQPTTVVMSPQTPPAIATSRKPRSSHPSPQSIARTGSPANVALALPSPQPQMSSEQTTPVAVSPSQPREVDRLPDTAQASPTPDAGDQIRDELRIDPITTAANPQQTFPPSPNAGIPSGFGANWGDVFISASLSGADRIRPEADGSLSAGFGLGDSRRAVGVELGYNLLSVRQFGDNGGFDAKVHRQVYSSDETQVAAAVGLNNFASYGPQAGGSPSSLYGVVTAAHLLQPEHPVNRMPITGTLGLGGGSFSGPGNDVGVIAGVGLQVHPQFSVNTAWSGVGVNVGASIVPVPTLPLTLNLLYGDIGNNTQAGSVAVLNVSYGFNFAPRF
ncbi:MAG: hypothetical protein AAFW95_04905, partial [Cyanobacteria bacterium J06638_6]